MKTEIIDIITSPDKSDVALKELFEDIVRMVELYQSQRYTSSDHLKNDIIEQLDDIQRLT